MNCFKPFKEIIPLSSTINKFVIKLMGERLIDVALHVPNRFETRSYFEHLKDTEHQELVTLYLNVAYHIPKHPRSRQPNKIILNDDHKERIEILYFKGTSAYFEKLFPVGRKVLISGKIDHHKPGKSPFFAKMAHPDFVGSLEDKNNWIGKKPIYPLTAGLVQNFVNRFVQKILNTIDKIPEWIDDKTLSTLSFPPFLTALNNLHKDPLQIASPTSPSQRRLCFDEFLSHQLALILASRQASLKASEGDPNAVKIISLEEVPLIQKFKEALPFSLTEGQKNVLHEIVQDFGKPHPMVRLLQGDVGSGKTVVAFILALYQISQGGQVAFLVPTEILAQQHFETISKLFGSSINVQLLTGRHTKKQRELLLKALENHQIDLLIGTHALIQDDVLFKNLTFCIIDEQHRFGVEQRVSLYKKGTRVHLLSMTATPIPRSLTLAQYGDMDVSLLKEKPKGRKDIVTTLLSQKKCSELLERLKEKLKEGEQIYWICPLIEESETSIKTAAEKRFEFLKDYFNCYRIEMVHGKMRPQQKDDTMQEFKKGNVQILVSTTVIEVGVDVPNASIMVIENAEQFGLAQLHQLRGRVGRGTKDSFCILMYGAFLTAIGKQRLDVMKSTSDGFLLAEMDLKLRGAGEIIGTQQSGMPAFKFANFEKATPSEQDMYNDLLQKANTYAWDLFLNPEHKEFLKIAKDVLLPIFKKDEATTFTKSG